MTNFKEFLGSLMILGIGLLQSNSCDIMEKIGTQKYWTI